MVNNNLVLILKEKATMSQDNECSLYEKIERNNILYEYYDSNNIKLFSMIFNINEKENIAEQISVKISYKSYIITSLTDVFYYIYNRLLEKYTLKINSDSPNDCNEENGYGYHRLSCISSYLNKISNADLTIHFNDNYINYCDLKKRYPAGFLDIMCEYDRIYIKACKRDKKC